ncbi:MAG: TolC family protein [Candidatus Omnitrophica bacterium]|nr:TolC family protein [Candidatus Omnitrophota bacterium]
MRITKILSEGILCLLLGTPSGFCDTAEEPRHYSLSLQDAIRIAFENNRDIQIQEEEIKVAKANILYAYGRFLPKVNLNTAYTHNGAILRLATTGAKKDVGVFSGYQNDNTMGVSIDETVYNGGADYANFKQAKIRLRIQEETLRLRKLNVAFETKRLYYGLLLAYENERIASSLLRQAQSHYEDVKHKFSQGIASRFDLLQSKVQVSKIKPEVVKANNAVESITADFKKLLSLKMQDSVEIKDKLIFFPIQVDEERFLKDAYMHRPEMNLKLLGIDMNKLQIQTAGASGLPQINASLNYGYRSNNLGNMFNSRHNLWSAGVSVSIPIFDAFSAMAKVEEAKARYVQSCLEKDNLGEQIAVEIKKGCLDLHQALSIIEASKDDIEEAKEALRIAQVRFYSGEGTNLDVLDSQVTLSQIEKNYSEAVYDYIMAKAFLEKSIGKEYFTEEGNEEKD